MRNLIALAGAGVMALSAVTLPGAASASCRAVGTGVGAVAGAVVGSNVAARNARTEGAVLGGLVGAVAGNQIAKSNCNSQCRTRTYYSEGHRYRVRECLDRHGRWRRG